MSKQKKTAAPAATDIVPAPVVIVPVSVTEADILVVEQEAISIPHGYVLLVALLEDGTDKPHSEFFYPEKSYRKYYSDETKFRVKAVHEFNEPENPYYENLNRTSQQITIRTTGRCSSCGR